MNADTDTDAIRKDDQSANLDPQQGVEPLACVSCRARKLKCDRAKPSCTRCTKVDNECLYPESRRKPTVKRKNVKELEARLAQVEDYLKEVTKNAENGSVDSAIPTVDNNHRPKAPGLVTEDNNSATAHAASRHEFADDPQDHTDPFSAGQLVGLGLSESLPPFQVMEELTTSFFTYQHAHIPIVHPTRFWQSFYGSAMRKPPMCLQYAMWALAAHGHEKFDTVAEVFYQRARQYAEADELKGMGEHFVTIGHAQAYAIIATFEAKCMLFTRAALTSGKCVRLVGMMGLDRLDGEQDDIPPALAPATSWVELEERRRTFWAAFAIDAHASISTGWSSLINTADITTNIPCSEEAFLSGSEEETCLLEEVFTGANYSGFASAIVICRVFKAIMHHVHRAKPHDQPEDLSRGKFWQRHHQLDNEVTSAFMFLPESLRLPGHVRDPAALHVNLNLYAAVICLHHAAIEKAEKYGHTDSVKQHSMGRLRASAEEIVNIVKLTSPNVGAFKSPLSALSLYCATTVYTYLAKDDEMSLTSIDKSKFNLLVQAMEAIGRVHQITKAFLQQTCLDIERNDLSSIIDLTSLSKYREAFGGAYSNIPLLARSAIGKHTNVAPVLPGKLPLRNPLGKARPSSLRLTEHHMPPVSGPGHENLECFQAMLGAVTRNVGNTGGGGLLDQSNKRKRVSPSPAGSADADSGATGFGSSSTSSKNTPSGTEGDTLDSNFLHNMSTIQNHRPPSTFTVADRTHASLSVPSTNTYNGFNDIQFGSKNDMFLGTMGLGNTLEENTFDFRPFQDRVAPPPWQSTGAATFGQITESVMSQVMVTEATDSWGILCEEIDWSKEAPSQ